jgi:hypothetical protein
MKGLICVDCVPTLDIPMCLEKDPVSKWACTRTYGHYGPHVACYIRSSYYQDPNHQRHARYKWDMTRGYPPPISREQFMAEMKSILNG